MRVRTLVGILACGLFASLAVGTNHASAFRERLAHPELGKREEWLRSEAAKAAELEGACGLAISPTDAHIYVSEYYRRAVDVYSAAEGLPVGAIGLADGGPRGPINTLNAVCGLAIDPAGNLYANEFHQAVVRLSAGEPVIDPGEATGIAVDGSGDLYVDDRTYVSVYDAPIEPGEAPAAKIGTGTLADGYGVAVDPTGKAIYVADAAAGTVSEYVPEISPSIPQAVTTYDFRSLVDTALAVDPTNGHVLVVDNLKPGAEDPEAAVLEFSAALDQPPDRLAPRHVSERPAEVNGPIFGEPSGIAVDPNTGDLYVTTGNGLGANVVKYGPFQPFAPPQAALPSESSAALARASATAAVGSGAERGQNPTAGSSEVVQRRGVRVRFDGRLTPRALPRHGVAPVGIAVDAEIAATGAAAPPQLRQIAIAINRNGRFNTQGLPVCRLRDIQPSTTANALAACRGSLVGEGHFSANVKLPEQSPFPSAGKVLAFNGRLHGKPAILAHIYGTQPAPTSTVLPFLINDSRGTYGTILEASLPRATGDWGYVTGLKMTLRRRFDYRGKGRSYLSAGCPAPAGFSAAEFPLARTSFDFAGGPTLVSILNRSCKATG
jgi:DNA-binding beta-propeller fold protein YncE